MRPEMSHSSRLFGQRAEAAAARFLHSRGYAIVEQNFTTRYGEVDIIARHGEALVFVEVKARRGLRRGSPREAINRLKQQKIIATASHYLRQHGIQNTPVRFEVVTMVEQRGTFVFELIPNAFQVI